MKMNYYHIKNSRSPTRYLQFYRTLNMQISSNLLPGDYLNIALRAHPQHTLQVIGSSSDSIADQQTSFSEGVQTEKILILNSADKVYFFDIRKRVSAGTSGLFRIVTPAQFLLVNKCPFNQKYHQHPSLLQTLITGPPTLPNNQAIQIHQQKHETPNTSPQITAGLGNGEQKHIKQAQNQPNPISQLKANKNNQKQLNSAEEVIAACADSNEYHQQYPPILKVIPKEQCFPYQDLSDELGIAAMLFENGQAFIAPNVNLNEMVLAHPSMMQQQTPTYPLIFDIQRISACRDANSTRQKREKTTNLDFQYYFIANRNSFWHLSAARDLSLLMTCENPLSYEAFYACSDFQLLIQPKCAHLIQGQNDQNQFMPTYDSNQLQVTALELPQGQLYTFVDQKETNLSTNKTSQTTRHLFICIDVTILRLSLVPLNKKSKKFKATLTPLVTLQNPLEPIISADLWQNFIVLTRSGQLTILNLEDSTSTQVQSYNQNLTAANFSMARISQNWCALVGNFNSYAQNDNRCRMLAINLPALLATCQPQYTQGIANRRSCQNTLFQSQMTILCAEILISLSNEKETLKQLLQDQLISFARNRLPKLQSIIFFQFDQWASILQSKSSSEEDILRFDILVSLIQKVSGLTHLKLALLQAQCYERIKQASLSDANVALKLRQLQSANVYPFQPNLKQIKMQPSIIDKNSHQGIPKCTICEAPMPLGFDFFTGCQTDVMMEDMSSQGDQTVEKENRISIYWQQVGQLLAQQKASCLANADIQHKRGVVQTVSHSFDIDPSFLTAKNYFQLKTK